MRTVLFIIGLLSATEVYAEEQQEVRERQTIACQADAMRLCGDYLLDEAKMTQCMVAKRQQVSQPCRAVIDEK